MVTHIDQDREIAALALHALEARGYAYAPYSGHSVGCALRSAEGHVFIGANCETANYDGTCAETGAIAAMITAGDRKIADLLVVGSATEQSAVQDFCPPCGRCRQRIYEFSDDMTRIYVLGAEGVLRQYSMAELLPEAFGPAHLEKERGSDHAEKE